jgi:hypothetical protein
MITTILSFIFKDALNVLILFLPLATIGLIVFLLSGQRLRLGLRAQNWPSVEGKITCSRVIHSNSSVTNSRDMHTHRRNRYRAAVKYTYMVAGQEYTGDTIGHDIPLSSEATPRSISQRYATGKTVPVYYNPDEPRTVVPEGALLFNFLGVGIGLLIAGDKPGGQG